MDQLPQRKRIRLKNYNYSENGCYFITVCTQGGRKLFWEVVGEGLNPVGRDDLGTPLCDDPGTPPCVSLSKYGKIVDKYISMIETHYDGVVVDKYCVMPNHVHIIITVARASNGAPGSSRPTNAHPSNNNVLKPNRPTMLIPTIIAALKKITNRACGVSLWQISYHDRIIRNEHEYLTRWQYIDTNPLKWKLDRYYI